jgi:hypothetical protein
MGLGRAAFDRLVGGATNPDYTVMDRILPHPVYARQNWIPSLNPSETSMRQALMPLVTEGHDRLAAERARTRAAR